MPAPSNRQGGGRRRLPVPPCTLDSRTDPAIDTEPHDGTEPDADDVARASASGAEIVRWGAFSCVLAPCTLLLCGGSSGAALGTAVGLAAVTAACRTLLRLSERGYSQQASARPDIDRPGPHRGRHSRTGTGLHRGGRHTGQP